MNIQSELYNQVRKIIIDEMKEEAKKWANTKTVNWSGDGYLTARQLRKAYSYRDRVREGSKLILEAFKKLGY
jgi:hypothetical protein